MIARYTTYGKLSMSLRPDPRSHAALCLLQVQHLPWFGAMQGYALVKPPGSFSHEDDPTAVIALTEGGHLCVHDVHSHSQETFHLEFQVRAHPSQPTAVLCNRTLPVAGSMLCLVLCDRAAVKAGLVLEHANLKPV